MKSFAALRLVSPAFLYGGEADLLVMAKAGAACGGIADLGRSDFMLRKVGKWPKNKR